MSSERPRTYATEALVLRYVPQGEADRLVTLFTPYLGKLRAVAKGVRRPTSKLGGNLELLVRAQVSIARGRNLDVVSQSQTLEGFSRLREDLWRITCGLYAAELVDSLVPYELPNPRVYDVLLQSLRRIEEGKAVALALRFLETQALALLGFGPELQRCLRCGRALEPVAQFLSPAEGGTLCPSCGRDDLQSRPLSLNMLKVLRMLQQGEWRVARRVRLSVELSLEVEMVLRQYLVYLLEREMRSVAFLDMVRRGISIAGAGQHTREAGR